MHEYEGDQLIIDRTADVDSIDASTLMNAALTWEYVNALPVNYITDDGAGSTVVLAFTLPISEDSAAVLPFAIGLEQVGMLALALTQALAAVYGKTLEDVIEDAKARIRDEQL